MGSVSWGRCRGTDELLGDVHHQQHVQRGDVVGVDLVAAEEELMWSGPGILVAVVVEDQVVDHRQRIRVGVSGPAAGAVEQVEVLEI